LLPIEKIKSHYSFTLNDIQNLKNLRSIFTRHKEEFVENFYSHIETYEDFSNYLVDDQVIARHKVSMLKWYLDLFNGQYSKDYERMLDRIGAVHVKVGLPSHYVNASMHFVEQFCMEILADEIEDKSELRYMSRSLAKILNIKLDIMTRSYVQEEVNRFFIFQRLESFLIRFSQRFAYGLNLALILGLVVIGFLAITLFGYDLFHTLRGDVEKGLLATLGALLMLWMVIELIDTEIEHLKGGKFAVQIFVGVALVAVIRELLISTLQPMESNMQIFLVAALAVLGGVYWLISKVK